MMIAPRGEGETFYTREIVGPQRRAFEKVGVYFFYAVAGSVVLAVFVQNFLFASSLGLSGFRDIDDLAFQIVLRKVHVAFDTGAWAQIWQINDYGYGWIYWIFVSILTYPLYLISDIYGVDWPLLVFPRQLSLLFAVASALTLVRLLRKSGASHFGGAAGGAIFLLLPATGYFSMRFGTVNAVVFFAVLSFYFAWTDAPSTARGRLLAILSLAIAGGIKFNGLLIAPLVGLLILLRIQDRSIFGVARAMALPSLAFVITFVACVNPALFYAPFDPSIWKKYIETMRFFLANAAVAGSVIRFHVRMYNGVFGTFVQVFVLSALLFGILIESTYNKKKSLDFIALAVLLVLLAILLGVFVLSVSGVALYVTVIAFICLMGIPGWLRLRGGFAVIGLAVAALILDSGTRLYHLTSYSAQARAAGLFYSESSLWNHFSYFVKNNDLFVSSEKANSISECIPDLNTRKWVGHIFYDYMISLKNNSLTNPNVCFSVSWGNISYDKRYCSGEVDYLILDKASPGSLPDEQYQKYIENKDIATKIRAQEDRKTRIDIAVRKRFGSRKLTLLCETAEIQVFRVFE